MEYQEPWTYTTNGSGWWFDPKTLTWQYYDASPSPNTTEKPQPPIANDGTAAMIGLHDENTTAKITW